MKSIAGRVVTAEWLQSGKAGMSVADVPAILLAGVSAVTVTVGARLLRGQSSALMLVLGIGVAGATFVLDKLLVERLNAVRPRQSLIALLICWVPLFLFATGLATIATFSWIVPEITQQDAAQARATHWAQEAQKVVTHLVEIKTGLRQASNTLAVEIDAERRRAAAARKLNAVHPPEPLRLLQRRLAAARDLERRMSSLQPLPLDVPQSDAQGQDLMSRAFRDLGDVHAAAQAVLTEIPPLPVYEPLRPPAHDVQSVLAEETKRGSWRAITAWGSALWVEVLPLLALWRGGQRIPLATRVMQWRTRTADTVNAVRGRCHPTPLPILIEPLQVRGVLRVALPKEYTLTDCTPLLEEAVDQLSDVRGSYQLRRISTSRGDDVNEALPLLPQLRGEPLVLSVVEDHA